MLALLTWASCKAGDSTNRSNSPAAWSDTGNSTPPEDTATTDLDGDGWSAQTDCDDGDAAVHPDAEETCDGRDQDCDGSIDEEASDSEEWCADLDQDGHGGGVPTIACAPPADEWVATCGDCAEGDAAVHPAARELCDSEQDEDCDGNVGHDDDDCTDRLLEDAGLRFVGASEDMEVGSTAFSAGDVTGDGSADLILQEYIEDRAGWSLLLVPGPFSAEVTVGVEHELITAGSDAYALNGAVRAVFDVDSDGVVDVLAGGSPEAHGGSVYWFSGPVSGQLTVDDADGAWRDYSLGESVAWATDADGEGSSAAVLGIPGARVLEDTEGGVAVFRGLHHGERELEAAAALLLTPDTSTGGGFQVVCEDVDGDGVDDVLTARSATSYQDQGSFLSGPGQAYLALGPASGTVQLEDDAHWVFTPNSNRPLVAVDLLQQAGGLPALMVATESHDTEASVLLFESSTRGEVDDDGASATISGELGDVLAAGAATPGDIDSDGFADLAVSGETVGGPTDWGIAYIAYGPFTGAIGAARWPRWRGPENSKAIGALVADDDLDGDGAKDVMVPVHSYPTALTDERTIFALLSSAL